MSTQRPQNGQSTTGKPSGTGRGNNPPRTPTKPTVPKPKK